MRRALLLLAALWLAGCNNMVRQDRYDDYGPSALFADGKAMQAPPEGTVARDAPAIAAASRRPPMSMRLLQRGRDRYEIACVPCHAYDGSGNGTVPARGYPHPPALTDPRVRALSPEQVYDVITHGYGVMYPYADRVSAPDRWAVAAYVQALGRLGPAQPAQPGR